MYAGQVTLGDQSRAGRHFAYQGVGVLETRLPTSEVVPPRRWWSTARAAEAASGPNSPRPPWQCTSTSPGERVRCPIQPVGGCTSLHRGGRSEALPANAIRSPSTTTALSLIMADGVTSRPVSRMPALVLTRE